MADIEEFLRTDLVHKSDLGKTATGDLDTISGLANVKMAIIHRILTEPGSLIHRPNYGVGIKQFQNAPNSLALQRQLALRIEEQLLQDPRVESVEGVRITTDDENPSLVVLIVRVNIVGYGETAITLTPFGEGV